MTDKASKPETSKAYAAFMAYCGLGPGRSLAKLAEYYHRNASYIRQLAIWSSTYNWVQRAKEYDKERMERQAQEDYERHQQAESERQAALKEMRERHAATARDLQQRTIDHLKMQIATGDIGSLPAVNLLKLVYETEQKAIDGVERLEFTGKDGGPVIIKTTWGTRKVERNKEEE